MALPEICRYGRTTTSHAASHIPISSSDTYSSFQRMDPATGLALQSRTRLLASGKTSPTTAMRAPVCRTIRGAASSRVSTPL